jgi:7-keto-8-aminopelargonate synthetase-like enzyme
VVIVSKDTVLATQAMVLALANRIHALEQALKEAGIQIPSVEKATIPEGQSRIDDYTGC